MRFGCTKKGSRVEFLSIIIIVALLAVALSLRSASRARAELQRIRDEVSRSPATIVGEIGRAHV